MSEVKRKGPGGPLAGLRILEVGHFVAAPFAARLLADYGAEVIKVEPPRVGDPMRSLGEKKNDQSLWWSSIARNKKCVTIDLRKSQGKSIFLDLVAKSDAVVENFRVGQLEQWDIGWDRIHEANPKAVLVRISGFGQTGPYKDRVAFAPIGEAFGGLRYLIRDPRAPEDRPPIRPSLSLGDSIAGLFASLGVLTALLGARTGSNSGLGRCVDVSMYESVFALLESSVSDFGVNGVVRQPAGSAVPNLAPSNTYRCFDGTWVCIASTSDRLFARLCRAMHKLDLIDDPRFRTNDVRAKNRNDLDEIIGEWVQAHSYEEVETRMLSESVPASKIYSIKDCIDDLHYRHRGSFIEVKEHDGSTVLQPNIFPLFGGADAPTVRWAGPSLGQHNAEVFKDLLGLSDERLTEMTRENVI
jgi:crotonobetainyl-CoA:carnitine CoA-transferase CaiB-like acyl-CoA transferase